MALPDYDRNMAIKLAAVCSCLYGIYGKYNTIDPKKYPEIDDFTVGELNKHDLNYTKKAIFTAHEVIFTNQEFQKRLPVEVMTGLNIKTPGTLQALSMGVGNTFFGLALEGKEGTEDSGNCIIALRGTQTVSEWLADLLYLAVPLFHRRKDQVMIESTSDVLNKLTGWEYYGKVHLGFLLLHQQLFNQVMAATGKFINPKTCFVTGHSLGAALAVLVALSLKLSTFSLLKGTEVRMYGFGGPRVGNPGFVKFYNDNLPASFRIVNLADTVPLVPPEKLFGYDYLHVGQEWSYLHQTGDVARNHSLRENYLPALKADVVTNTRRIYPASGFGGG
jgi:hypothetical protein